MCIFYSNPLTCRDYEGRYFSPRKELNYINLKGFCNPSLYKVFSACKDMIFL